MSGGLVFVLKLCVKNGIIRIKTDRCDGVTVLKSHTIFLRRTCVCQLMRKE